MEERQKEREKNAVAYMKVLSGNLSKLVEVFKQKSYYAKKEAD